MPSTSMERGRGGGGWGIIGGGKVASFAELLDRSRRQVRGQKVLPTRSHQKLNFVRFIKRHAASLLLMILRDIDNKSV